MMPNPKPNEGIARPLFSNFLAVKTKNAAIESMPKVAVARSETESKSIEIVAKTKLTMKRATKAKNATVTFVNSLLPGWGLTMVMKVSSAMTSSTIVSSRLPNSIKP